MKPLTVTYLGGPTALLEFCGLRLLTDPTLDPADTEYPTPAYTLRKTQAPALDAAALVNIDAVLLSHDHHFDNLDHAGRAALSRAGVVCTTLDGATRLGGNAVGMRPGDIRMMPTPDGCAVRVTATPARHGPVDGDRGPCIGFLLEPVDGDRVPGPVVYVSGDTVWYEAVEAIGRGMIVHFAFLNLGAARVPAAGPHHLTFTAEEAVQLARAWPSATLIPLHFEGWRHFSEGRSEVDAAFQAAGLSHRLHWMPAGVPTLLPTPA